MKLLKLTLLFVSILLFSFWILWVVLLAGGGAGVDARIDFFAFWGGASFALDGDASAAYDEVRMTQKQLELPGSFYGVFKWLYPPTFFLFLLPFGLLPMAAALASWVVVTAALMASALRRLTNQWPVLLLTFLFPGTYFNFLIGQNGMLTAGLFAWGILLLREKPVLAGAILGLITYKPQFFPLIVLALLCGRNRNAAVAAMCSAAGIGLISLFLFGIDSWQAFVDAATGTGADIYSSSPFVHLDKMQSISATLRLLEASALVSRVTQVVFFLACAMIVAWLWWRHAPEEYRYAGLSLCVLLATPYVYHYDLTLLGLAVIWIGTRLHKDRSFRVWHGALFAGAFVLPLAGPLLARYTDIVVGPFVLFALLIVVVHEAARTAYVRGFHESDQPELLALPEA